ncbi:MAG: hypothetical protein GXO85_11805 [Chlorobi bacterium]|nr:hypothetical protein [Chlorobiota bacterium]
MKRLTIYITLLILMVLNNHQFSQSRPVKVINAKEVKFVKQQSTLPAKIELPKPKGESEIIRTESKRKTKFSNPPQRPEIETPLPARSQHFPRIIANEPEQVLICGSGSAIDYYGDVLSFQKQNKGEEEIVIEEQRENYYPVIKYLKGREFTDEDFPICIKKIEFDYSRSQWIDSDDLPGSMIDRQSNNYSIYKIKFDAYVFDLSYNYPFAALITYPDYSTDIVIYNYDSQNLQADSVYSFEEEMPLKETGYAWLALGYYDLQYDQFYSAAFSPYITKQKVYIPFPDE